MNKPISQAQRLYWNELCEADDKSKITSFAQIMSRQAVHIGNMVKCRRDKSFKGVYDNWSRMEQLNHAWVGLVMSPFLSCPKTDMDRLDRLRRVATDMARGYTSTIAELVLFGTVDDKQLQDVIGAEARFFSVALGNESSIYDNHSNAESETRKHWFQHTGAVIDMLGAAQTGDPDNFHYAAANCIIHGRLLGSWLDGVFLGK